MSKYPEYKQLNLSQIGKDVLKYWKDEQIFEKSISTRPENKPYTFYEGPPSANGMPGIHHVMARSIKDIFCRYKTLQGFQVKRKGGWDTHGLPIELAVEKALGITKEDIGKKISVDDYNAACKKEVMRYTDVWNDLTEKMGYWVDLNDPYVTYHNEYIETLWWLLQQMYKKGLLYKGYTIQPYSPAAGTGLSSHELNQPGTYKMVKDTTVVAQFKIIRNELSEKIFSGINSDVHFIAWTTTPWTLPSNTALAVGKGIEYVLVQSFNQYTFEPIYVILAKDLCGKYFSDKNAELTIEEYKPGDKNIPYKILNSFKGIDLVGIQYDQLLPYAQPEDGDAFKVIIGDFVTTEDGTGIVHIAPSFGADDFRVAKQNGIGSLTLVDKRGKFLESVTDFANEFVKEDYLSAEEKEVERTKQGRDKYLSVDERISIKLKTENKAFKVEKYEHTYPHCWRTDKPVLYYPLDSWFIKTTALKERMVELNKTINWKPESTGTGRFGNWLENLVDWNLSRSRYWGTPLPIWRTEDELEERCIGTVTELKEALKEAVVSDALNADEKIKLQDIIKQYDNNTYDLHRPYVDDIILVSKSGKKMIRETDLIDVWFDSGAMPYAQWGLDMQKLAAGDPQPFASGWNGAYPADFIAEGVDQTRGWFFTLHAIGVLLFDSIAYKNVVSNGLVLDKSGNKMSKRLGNAVDPFETIEKFGSDATRWYMISNAAPWENLKFDLEGLQEVQRKFFGTLYNTYAFFALYANIDQFEIDEQNLIPVSNRPELDRWIISSLHALIKDVEEAYENYEPHRAARYIQTFVDENLSNWYVRLARRRFWRGEMTDDKKSAYETLFECLTVCSKLMSPIAPFFSDWMYKNLTDGIRAKSIQFNTSLKEESIHLSTWANSDESLIEVGLNESMKLAQDISSMILSLRKKVNINVRQPLQKVLIPILDDQFEAKVERVKSLILSETNIKELTYLKDTEGFIKKKIKPNFKLLGAKVGKDMKEVAAEIAIFNQENILLLEKEGQITLKTGGYELLIDEVEIIADDIPGWLVNVMGSLTVALDVNISEELRLEGIAREFVNRIQNLRKDKGFEVTDRINVVVAENEFIKEAINHNLNYICAEILANNLEFASTLTTKERVEINEKEIYISIEKAS
ncbi:MAG: isoleucine--tRNA ligase [Sphingobacteriales bacterium]|nr:isoleucine--tRNA ligase [Sphingobacteriales bacterium]